jgi:hypothetical protein
MIQQQPYEIIMAVVCGVVQWRPPIPIAYVGICPIAEQQLRYFNLVKRTANDKWGATLRIAANCVRVCPLLKEQGSHTDLAI